MVFDEQAYLAAYPDVAAAIASGGMPNARFHYDNHGAAEIASGARLPVAMTGAAPQPDYASRYHEIRGIGTDFGALGMDVPDYTQTAVSTAAHRNPWHYVNSQTGDLNRDQLQSDIQSGAFRYNPDYYAAQSPDLAAAGITSGTDLMNHFLDHGWSEGRSYAIDNPYYDSDISNGFGGTVPGVNGSALPQFQSTLGGWGTDPVGGGGGAGSGGAAPPAAQPQNAFDPDAFMGQMQDMFTNWQNQWQQNQQSQWDALYDNIGQWGETAYNGAGATNNGFQAGYPTNLSPVYNPNPNGATPRNGFGGPLGNNNPWSPTF